MRTSVKPISWALALAVVAVPQLRSSPVLEVQYTPFIVGAGDPNDARYLTPAGTGYDGVGMLIIARATGTFLCSGSLLGTGSHVLTAAHCVTDGSGVMDVTSLTATFFPFPSGTEAIGGTAVTVHPGWTGDLRRGDDLAVVTLAQRASSGVQRYGLYTSSGELGSTFDVSGYGMRGTGATGATLAPGARRHGLNEFDATMTGTLGILPGWTAGDRVLLSDFDSGLAANDAFGYFFGINGLGRGLDEASTALGDSGGPGFIGARIAAITSFGVRLSYVGGGTSDVDGSLNSSFGEFAGFTRVSPYAGWVNSATGVPEPSTWVLLGMGLAWLACLRRRGAH